MKMVVHSIAALVLLGCVAPAVMASPASTALAACMADNTTGKDRKDLARWIFSSMAIHPEIQPYSRLSDNDRVKIDKQLAAMVETLVVERCRESARLALEQDGGNAFKEAFGMLGQVAMREIMADPAVNAALGQFANYLNEDKFNSAFKK
ncbi:hypothetical protein INR99_06740 [Chitinilyticum litopenaei]|uniref:Uncharacterized protein n=2 Tax=Chitinilyticum piscinae TaxID=2866724 RepID=A0A8J7KE03_9NEIS|nr:hypothetical protein [Chitinilyticum piscinae]